MIQQNPSQLSSFLYEIAINFIIVICTLFISLQPVADIYNVIGESSEWELNDQDPKDEKEERENEKRENEKRENEEKLFHTQYPSFNLLADGLLLKSSIKSFFEDKQLLDSFAPDVSPPPPEFSA